MVSLFPGHFCVETERPCKSYPTQLTRVVAHTTTNIVNLLDADEAARSTLCFIREHVHPADVPAVATPRVGRSSDKEVIEVVIVDVTRCSCGAEPFAHHLALDFDVLLSVVVEAIFADVRSSFQAVLVRNSNDQIHFSAGKKLSFTQRSAGLLISVASTPARRSTKSNLMNPLNRNILHLISINLLPEYLATLEDQGTPMTRLFS